MKACCIGNIKKKNLGERSEKDDFRLDGSSPANPVNGRRVANDVTLKSTFCLP